MSNKDLKELRYQIPQSEKELKKADEELNKLYKEYNKIPYQTVLLLEENADLELVNKLSVEDIASYKKELENLKEKQKKKRRRNCKIKKRKRKFAKK